MEKKILKAVYSLLIVITLIGLLLMTIGNTIGFILIPMVILYLGASFGSIKEDEIGAKFIFGKEVSELKSGAYFAPLGIVRVRKFYSNERQNELPSEPEDIYEGDGETPKGKFKPIRIKFGQPRDDDSEALKNDPYNFPMVTEVVPVIKWKIVKVIPFVKTMKDEENCLKILTDKTIAIFSDNLSKITPAKAMLDLFDISTMLEEKLKADISSTSGIRIIDAYLKPFNFSHSLNKSVVGVSIAKQDARAMEYHAIGERKRLIEEGMGNADAEQRMLRARAEMREILLRVERENLRDTIALTSDEKAQFVLWNQTLKSAYENSNFSVIPSGDIYSAAAGLSEMLKKITGGS